MRNLLAVVLLTGLLAAPAGAVGPAPSAEDDPVPVTGDGVPEDAPGSRWSVSAEYLLWWLREGRLPPTLTTSSPASRGLLGRPDTQTLYGGDRLETRHGDRFNGIEATLGYWFDDAQTVGLEGSAFFLERDSTYFKALSGGGTLLARPYENPDGSPASAILAGPTPAGRRDGGFVGYSRVELFGEAADLVAPLYVGAAGRLEALAGARFLQLRDRTDLTASGHALPAGEPLFGLEDHYRADDAYYGAALGLRGERTCGRWSLQLRGEAGLGANAEQVRAFGLRLVQTPAARVVTPTGLTVQAANTGTFDRTAVNLVSEAGLRVGYRVTDHLRAFGGYTFLLWDGAVRSGDQVDPVARPAIPFKEDLFWAQGLDAGLELTW